MNNLQKLIHAIMLRLSSFNAVVLSEAEKGRKRFVRALALIIAVSLFMASVGEYYVPVVIAAQNTEISETDLFTQSIELYPEGKKAEKSVTLNGMMPKDADAEAVDVTEEYNTEKETAKLSEKNPTASLIAAYDITITADKKEYQPDETRPIRVEISHPDLDSKRAVVLWHIKDDGTREKVKRFKLEDGKITFNATGFSVYAIVDINSPFSFETANTLAELESTRASEGGLCLFYNTGNYFTSELNNNDALIETTDVENAAIWYLEKVDSDYKIYTYVGGVKKYIHNKSGNLIELSDSADLFVISQVSANNNTSFYLKKKNENKWLQHSGSGSGIRYWTDNKNATNSRIKAAYADSLFLPDDYYGLDGKSYGIMSYQGGTVGNAFMADGSSPNYISMNSMTVRQESGNNTLYVAEDSDITLWTFNWISDVQYKLSTEVNGVTKYLKMDGSTLSLVNENEASSISVSSNNQGNVKLSCNGKSVYFGSSGFSCANTSSDNNQWMYLVELSGLSNEDYITYSANKVSISDVEDGKHVIVYTRVWDDSKKRYDFYAIDHDGTLYPCYERGDDIMWVGNQINSLLWNFTEYHYEDGTPNYYYELFNPYSEKYIAPQIDGQTLSDDPIGINLPGRRAGDYYSTIIAWDDPYYAYAGLQSDIANSIIESGNKANADTFYFAEIESVVPTLTKVDTIDNNDFGVTMKMIDFPVQPNTSTGVSYQNDFLGTTASSSVHGMKNLLSTNLDPVTGYPTARSGASLGTLYSGATEVNHLFVESIYNSSGYFEFDSCQNFATLLDENGQRTSNFTVYKELGTTDVVSRSTLRHGQFFPYNSITAGVYSEKNPENLYSALASMDNPNTGLLPESDPRKYEKLHLINGTPNYYNGMEMRASFVKTPQGKDSWGHDIIFEFTGDDDFWFYVDGELVIDLGGIHSALEGSVNFSTGEVVVDGVHSTLRQVFENNYRTRNPNATQAEVDAFLADYFDAGKTVFKDYSTHSMTVFYMERGAGASNLHMRFNLAYVTPGSVMLTKNVSGSDDADFKLAEYPYQIWYIDESSGQEKLLGNDNENINVTYQNSIQTVDYEASYTPPNSSVTYNNVYFLNPDMIAEVHFPADTISYKIIECGVNTEVYDEVKVNGTVIQSDPHDTNVRKSFDSGWHTVSEQPNVVFDNHVNAAGLRTLSFQKILLDEEDNELTAEDDPTTFSFRLYLTNGSDENLELANMQKYYVTDPDGYICRWDSTARAFTPTSETDYTDLTEAEKEQYTYETSINGSISKIPAGYIVEVPNIPVGTKFMLVERDYEIPTGYTFVKYERESGTYHVEDGDTLNSGWVRANESPKMFIYNKRGWGLEVNKIWSDKSFTSSHGNIFTAVYYGNTLVPNTVRCISDPDTSTRYYFEELLPGADFDDYTVHEVELTNPVIDSDGNVISYSSITRLNGGVDDTIVSAVSKKTGTSSDYTYAVDYDVGTPISSSGDDYFYNVRTDTITNSRVGGIALTLYDMDTNDPLGGGKFNLYQGSTKLGTFTTDTNGKITVLYDFEYDTDYTLTQTGIPKGYIGLPNTVTFSFNDDNTVNISGNENKWQTGYKSSVTGDRLVAYVDVFNEPYTLQAIKIDRDSLDPLAGAHFTLYKGVSGIGGIVKDSRPMRGYEDIVTGANGVITGIDNTLPAGRYYLTETATPDNYRGMESDIVFTVSEGGTVAIVGSEHSELLTATGTTKLNYVLNVPNIYNSTAHLTVNKTVRGNLGNRAREFEFMLTVGGAEATDEFEWSLNGVEQTDKIHTGDTFTLSDGDSVTFVLPIDRQVTVTEDNEGYTTVMKLDGSQSVTTNTRTFVLDDDKELDVVNTRDGIIPTGLYYITVTAAAVMVLFIAGASLLIYLKKRRYINNADG